MTGSAAAPGSVADGVLVAFPARCVRSVAQVPGWANDLNTLFTGGQEIGMTSEVTDTPRSGRPSTAGGIAWHTLSADEVLQSPRVDGQRGLS